MKSIRTTTQGKEYSLKLKRYGFWAATERFEKTFAEKIQNIAEIVDTLRNEETNEEIRGENTKETVMEFCPNCETEIEMRWDVKTQGYKLFCPVCGGRLMLCDECQHREEDGAYTGDCDYDSKTDTCRFNCDNARKGGDAGQARAIAKTETQKHFRRID